MFKYLMKNTFPLLFFLICGCATEYGASSFSGGFTDQITGNNTAVVTFKSNAFTDEVTTRKYAMRRAAELTLENGYDYFLIEGGGDYSKEGTTSSSVNCYTIGYNVTCDEIGGYSYSKPRTTLSIRMFNGQTPNQTGFYDARFLAYK